GSGQAWPCRKSQPAWWQRNRHQLSRPGDGGQAVATPARTGAQGCSCPCLSEATAKALRHWRLIGLRVFGGTRFIEVALLPSRKLRRKAWRDDTRAIRLSTRQYATRLSCSGSVVNLNKMYVPGLDAPSSTFVGGP